MARKLDDDIPIPTFGKVAAAEGEAKKPDPDDEDLVKPDVRMTELERMRLENEELKEKLAAAEMSAAALAVIDKTRLEEAQAGALQMSHIREVSAGTRQVKRLDEDGDPITRRVQKFHDDGEPMLDDDDKPIYKREPVYDEEEVFFYKIDLPPSGGTGIRINGTDYFHGEVYKFNIDQLRNVKDIIARGWKHEEVTFGKNENFYRKESAPTIRGTH